MRKGLGFVDSKITCLHQHGTGPAAGWEEKNGFDACCDDEMDGEPQCLPERTGPSRSDPDGFN
jgi:hypothetical protein